MAAADPQHPGELDADSTSRQATEDFFTEDLDTDSRADINHTNSMRDKEKKIGHRRVDKAGIVSYKKKPTSELMAAIQLGIGQSVGGLSSKPERDVLMQDFGVVEVVFFPSEGSNLTPAHHCSDFRFKTYAPVAFRYFRDLFGIQPEDFMLSLCNEPLKELSNPGASGSIFYLTHDDEFIIKTVQHKEAEFLQKLLPGYFLNISQNKRTLLPKFYGLYCYQCGGKNIRFTVMNNLLPSTVQLHEKYDMKGSTYNRKASKSERSKKSPTLKDLDFMEIHPESLQLEKDIYDSLIKTLQRDCRVLESFKIMDYSLLVGIYNLDLINKGHRNSATMDPEVAAESLHGSTGVGLQRAKSIRTRIGQYSTPLESIQGNTDADFRDDMEDDEDVPPGGIPARNAKGERILIYLGIIDILQSFRLKKRLEHTVKSMVIDGDTISVHRPSYYAQRFLQYHATRVFRKLATALKHSPSKRRALNKSTAKPTPGPNDQPEQHSISHSNPRSSRTISFSDEQNAVTTDDSGNSKPPDHLPEYSKSAKRSPRSHRGANVNGNSSQQKRSDAFTLSTYPSEDALSAGTASTASLRAIGVGSGSGYPSGGRGPSPPLSLSESTPTHTDFTEGTPSFTNSSPSCSSDVMATYNKKAVVTFCTPPSTPPISTITNTTPAAITTTTTTTNNNAVSSENHVTFKLPPTSSSSGMDDVNDDGDDGDDEYHHHLSEEEENMGGAVSPLEGMDSPTTSHYHHQHHHHHHRSPDLHRQQGSGRMMHSGKISSTTTTTTAGSSGLSGRSSTKTTEGGDKEKDDKSGEEISTIMTGGDDQVSPTHSLSSPSKQRMTQVTVTVIPESPPPPFEAVVGDEDGSVSTALSSSPRKQQQHHFTTTTTYTKKETTSGVDGGVTVTTSEAFVSSASPAINNNDAVDDEEEGGGGADEDEMTRL